MFLLWAVIFVVALVALVKGADWLTSSAERIGLAIGFSPFIVGVTIVGVGTSLPELVSSFVATVRGVTDLAVANAVGSNIANILLIVGFSAVVARKLTLTRNLIDLDLPLLAAATTVLLGVIWDKKVTFGESVLMLIAYIIYLLYTSLERDEEKIEEDIKEKDINSLGLQKNKKERIITQEKEITRPKIKVRDFIFLAAGILGLFLGAEYLIKAVVRLSEILKVGTGIISITAVAVGTSLPEFLVSVKTAFQKKSEISVGNILGSNVFNALVVTGFPGLFGTLLVDEKTFFVGAPAMTIATFLLVISGISKRIHIWEGVFYVFIYILFLAKLFGWF